LEGGGRRGGGGGESGGGDLFNEGEKGELKALVLLQPKSRLDQNESFSGGSVKVENPEKKKKSDHKDAESKEEMEPKPGQKSWL